MARHWVLLPVVVVYLWSFPFYERLNNPNELVRAYMTMAVVQDGTYDISGVCLKHSWVNDRSVVGQRAYSSKAPGASLAGVPVYALARAAARNLGFEMDLAHTVWVLRVGVVVIPALVFLLVFRRYLFTMDVTPFVREVSFAGFALGSTFFANIYQFAGHVPCACVLFGSYILLDGARRRGRWGPWRALGFGLLLGAAPVMEYQALVPASLVAVAFLAHRRARRPLVVGMAAAGSSLPLGLMAHFHTSAFGSPFTTGYSFIENPAFQLDFAQGWMGITYPRLSTLEQLLLSWDTGLLVFSPMLALSVLLPFTIHVLGHMEGFRRRIVHVCVVSTLVTLTLVLFVGSLIFWRAGWTAGPRYLTSLIPFATVLSMLALQAAERIWGFAARVLALALCLLGVCYSGASGAIYPHLPVTFHNPLLEIVWPMIRDGFVPYNAGMLLGLDGWKGFLPALVLGVLPPVLYVVWLSYPGYAHRSSCLVTAALLVALALMPMYRKSLATSPSPWAMEDLNAVYTSFEPVQKVSLLERNGCETYGSLFQLRCDDPITRARLQARMGMRWLAMLGYRRTVSSSPGRGSEP